MRIFILFLTLLVSINFAQVVGETDTPFDVEGWDAPIDSSKYYKLKYYQLLSNPGGWINRNTRDIDSLFNELIVFTDTTQLIIRNDSLFFSEQFIQNILDSSFVASLNIGTPYLDIAAGDTLTLLRKYFQFIPDTTLSYAEGKVFYDSTSHSLVVYNDESEVIQQIGREFYIRVYNNSGSTITNGSVVYMSGSASYEPPVINLADASDEAKIRDLAFATHDIENGTYGYAVSAGILNNVNTSSFAVDESLYLDHLTPGGLTNTKPPTPYESIRVGLVLKSDTTDGKVYIDIEEYHGVDDIAAIYFADSSYTITLTQNVEARITNTGNNLFSLDSSITHGISLSGDSVYVSDDGEYILDVGLSFGGGTAGLYQIYTKTNGVTNSRYKAARATSNSDYGNFGFHAVLNLTAGDAVTFWVINTGSGTGYIARHGNVVIEQVR